MALTIQNSIAAINTVLSAGLVPFLKGSPGLGKSDAIKAIAAKKNLKVIDVRLSQCDPTDLNGLPMFKNGIAVYQPFEQFPLAHTDKPYVDRTSQEVHDMLNDSVFNMRMFGKVTGLPLDTLEEVSKAHAEGMNAEDIHAAIHELGLPTERYDGWLLFLDELPNADISVQQAAYKLVLDKQVAAHDLHPDCAIVVAGNREEDNSYVKAMPDALKSRLIHLNLAISKDEWETWAISTDIDPRVISFIGYAPDRLLRTVADSSADTHACPRTWHFMSNIMQMYPDIPTDPKELSLFRELIYGTVGQVDGQYFYEYIMYFNKLPKFTDILKDAANFPIPEELGIKFATCSMIMSHTDKSNVDMILPFIQRLPIELKIMTFRSIIQRNKGEGILNLPSMKDAFEEIGKYLYGKN